jgi:hypothetical protein
MADRAILPAGVLWCQGCAWKGTGGGPIDGNHWVCPICDTVNQTTQQAEATDQQILHKWDTHVGDPTPKYPFTDSDKIAFARAVIALAALAAEEGETPEQVSRRLHAERNKP